ncbi:hypothetical protein [Ferrovum sp.]|uniref:hypothetical protein n=1 Tax=Ferrovum sp. TaxID=2609467 RepID=UPI00260EE6DA|nr:hypothetical protein [Ferrovum sp.]
MPKQYQQPIENTAGYSQEFRLLIETMAVRRFGETVTPDSLARFLGFEGGVLERSRLTGLRTGANANGNTLDIREDGSVPSIELAHWLFQKTRIPSAYICQLFSDEKNIPLLTRFPKTSVEARSKRFPYYFSQGGQLCRHNHLAIRKTANRECLFCSLEKTENKIRSRANKKLFGVAMDGIAPVVDAFERLPGTSKTVLLDWFVKNIEVEPELVAKLALNYLNKAEIRAELVRQNTDVEVDCFLSAVRAWGRNRKSGKSVRVGGGGSNLTNRGK